MTGIENHCNSVVDSFNYLKCYWVKSWCHILTNDYVTNFNSISLKRFGLKGLIFSVDYEYEVADSDDVSGVFAGLVCFSLTEALFVIWIPVENVGSKLKHLDNLLYTLLGWKSV